LQKFGRFQVPNLPNLPSVLHRFQEISLANVSAPNYLK
jgi:hypothetical protein